MDGGKTIEEKELNAIITAGESLEREFKSDRGNGLSDHDLLAAIVSLANTKGGVLLLGVEDDGHITGLHRRHQDAIGMQSMIANRTVPSICPDVGLLHVFGEEVMKILVRESKSLVATSDGVLQRRRMKADGTPESVPFYPHEFASRQASLGMADPSAMVMEDIDAAQLDPLQRVRVRNAIKNTRATPHCPCWPMTNWTARCAFARQQADGAIRP